MEDTRVFDHDYRFWSCDVCRNGVFTNSCGCIEYTDLTLNRRLEDLELQHLGRLVYSNPEILERLKDQVEVGHAVWNLDRRKRLLDESWAAYEPFDAQYYEDDSGF
jgi:hypothetical protein